MKTKKYAFLLCFMLSCVCLSAQDREVITVSSNDNIAELISEDKQYIFPEFTSGRVIYKTKRPVGGGKLNYNLLFGEMVFIDPANEIFALEDVKDILMVVIDNRRFYPHRNEEFTEELFETTSEVQLHIKREFTIISDGKEGAYGLSFSAASISHYSHVDAQGSSRQQLAIKENMLVQRKNTYYLVGKNDKHKLIKGVKTFQELFPKQKKQIESFVKEHNISFNKEEDLMNLIKYCDTL